MRISDWSSDVCSSDLTEPEKRKLWVADGPMELREGGAVELVFDHDHLSVDDVPYPEDAIRWKGVTSRETVVAIDRPRLQAMTWDGGKKGVARFDPTTEGEIGRASCREKECNVV